MNRARAGAFVAAAIAAACAAAAAGPTFPIDASHCPDAHLGGADLQAQAEAIVAGLPADGDPAPRVLSATCVPRGGALPPSREMPRLDLPDAQTWVLVADGSFPTPPEFPFPNHPRFRRRISTYIDVGRLVRGADGAPGMQTPPPATQAAPPDETRGWFLVDDATGRAAGFVSRREEWLR